LKQEFEEIIKKLNMTPIYRKRGRGRSVLSSKNISNCSFCGKIVYITKNTAKHTNILHEPQEHFFCSNSHKLEWISLRSKYSDLPIKEFEKIKQEIIENLLW